MAKSIIIALDGLSQARALEIAVLLKGKVWGFKLTDLLFCDTAMIGRLKRYGRVFADAKLHDIPSTVAHEVRALSVAGADLITVHASGGVDMMRAARRAAGRSKVIAVTVLTSQAGRSVRSDVVRRAEDALSADMAGVVCSAHELSALAGLRRMDTLLKVVPGIRPDWYRRSDDQFRTATPGQALQWGADLLVIGRPIVSSREPVRALERILSGLHETS